MNSGHDQENEYHRSRQPSRATAGAADNDSIAPSQNGMLLSLPGLMRSTSIDARCNASVRAAAMGQMQLVYGNQAAQRFIQRSPATPQGAGSEEEESGWPRWLSTLPGPLRTLANYVGNMPELASTPAHGSSPAPQPQLTEGRSPLG